MMTHGSLFSGIGGFDLGAELAGLKNKWQVEIDPWCRKLLKQNFPEVKRYEDIKTVGRHNLEPVDIISGGFPCQPFSVAGRRNGKNDDRFLWPEMLRVIREMRPSFVVGENVTGIVSMALDQVLTDLENEGYTCDDPYIIPACAVNAPHRRDRVWIIAYNNGIRCKLRGFERQRVYGDKTLDEINTGTIANTLRLRLQGRHKGWSSKRVETLSEEQLRWNISTSRVCRGNDGIPYRMDRLKGLGNSIVPQIAFVFFDAIRRLYES